MVTILQALGFMLLGATIYIGGITMFRKYAMNDREKCELEEYRGTGLTPDQIKSIKRDAEKWREYCEWLKEL